MIKYSGLILILFFGCTSCSQKDDQTENLQAFAAVYGYVKYFHPSDEAHQTDWDTFAIYGTEKILACKSEKELNETLKTLFKPIAPTLQFSNSEISTASMAAIVEPKNLKGYVEYFWHHQGVGFGMENSGGIYQSTRVEVQAQNDTISYRPKFGETISKKIGDNLFCSIPIVLYHNKEGTYPKTDVETIEKLNYTLENFNIDENGLAFRLGNVVNTYNVFQHFYPYFDVVDVDWHLELKKALEKSFEDKTKKDHIITLEKFTSALKDGHLTVESRETRKNIFSPPVSWEWIENKLIITKVWNDSLPIKIGDEITQINNQNARDYFDEIESRISAGTKGWMRHKSEQLAIRGEKDSKITMTINGKNIVLIRNQDPYSEPKKYDSYIEMDNGIHYLNISLLDMDAFEYLLPRLEKSNGIIFDLRGYPNSGNWKMLSHFLKVNDTLKSWLQIPQIVFPDQTPEPEYEKFDFINEVKAPYLGNKKAVFLTHGSAISAAESYMNTVKKNDFATIVGQPTAGANGMVNSFLLPWHIEIRFTGTKAFKFDGKPFHCEGVLPDVYIQKTVQGVIEGRDEFLEKAIEIAKQK